MFPGEIFHPIEPIDWFRWRQSKRSSPKILNAEFSYINLAHEAIWIKTKTNSKSTSKTPGFTSAEIITSASQTRAKLPKPKIRDNMTI